jgi:flagellar biosynthetic protein FliO
LNATSRALPRPESSLTQLGWTFFGVAAAFIAATWWLRWRRQQSLPASEGPALEVVRSVALSGRDRLHLVRVGEQYLVVGHTASQITLLSEVAAPASKREATPTQPPSWDEAQDSMNAFFKQVEQTKISSA